MARKKTSKGVLEQIGDTVTAGAEAVRDAGAKAASAVGGLLPKGKAGPKRGVKKTKAKAPKAAAKTAATKKSSTKAKAAPASGKKAAAPKAVKSTGGAKAKKSTGKKS